MGLSHDPHRSEICKHTAKAKLTKSEAKSLAKRINRRSKNFNLSAYLCRICKKWHVGNTPGRKRKG